MRRPVTATHPCDKSPRVTCMFFMQFDAATCCSDVSHEFKSVWIPGTRCSDKMSHAHSVPSCDSTCDNSVNKPITAFSARPSWSLTCYQYHSAELECRKQHVVASSRILCHVHVGDFVAATSHLMWQDLSCTVDCFDAGSASSCTCSLLC